MEKTFVLDANVLLHDPSAIYSFGNNKVVIIISVLSEIDSFKKNQGQIGANSREVARELDRISKNGCFSSGITLDNGGKLFVYPYHKNGLKINCDQSVDNNLLCETDYLIKNNENAILVSKDIILRVMANGLGIPAEDYENDRKDVESYSGISELVLSDDEMENFVKGPSFIPEGYKGFPNQYVHVVSESDSKKSLIGKTLKDGSIVMMKSNGIHALNIKPKNMEQIFAMDALFDDNVRIVTIQGRAGTGKTLLAIASGISQTLSEKYSRLSVTRPVIPVGKDIGFLPGDIDEKMAPWMQPIYDAIDLIREFDRNNGRTTLSSKFTDDMIQVAPLMYMRGRSIPHSFMIVDECLVGDTYVVTSKGKRKLKNIVSAFHKGEEIFVKTFNENSKIFEYKKLLNAWNRGINETIKITSSKREIICTRNHKFLTNKGWIRADKLSVGNVLMTTPPGSLQICSELNDDNLQIVLGSFLGDGSFSKTGLNRYRLEITHGFNQIEYNSWKASLFKKEIHVNPIGGFANRPTNSFISDTFIVENDFPVSKKTCPQWILDNINEKGLAIWFMDDGSSGKFGNECRFYTCSFDEESHLRIVDCLKKKFDIESKILFDRKYRYISIDKENYIKLCLLISPYIHQSMSYKIKHNTDKISYYKWDSIDKSYGLTVVDKIVDYGKNEVFDIEVEDNHNFVICSSSKGKYRCNDGIIVHNCQNLTPKEIKTIVTRSGEDTKLVFTGDIEQIDNPFLDIRSNGLSYLISKFKPYDIHAHVSLKQGERSRLAEIGSNIL